MKFLDLSLASSATNLACDEALLDWCESERGPEILRFWEPSEAFVVVGYSNNCGSEVKLPACRRAKVPVFRRCSGGGAVVLAPGCLSYSLILDTGRRALATVTMTNAYAMERNRAALARASGREVSVRGVTDLVADGRKVSGNAQRRRRRYALFHGTFLLGMDLRLVERFLRFPSRSPEYRGGRPHGDFLSNLNIHPESIKREMRRAWAARGRPRHLPMDRLAALAREKYDALE